MTRQAGTPSDNPLDPNGFEPEFFLYHRGGPWLRATFSSANDAYVWQRGNQGRRYADMFFITNADGERVVLEDQPHHPGHAYAILESLGRQT